MPVPAGSDAAVDAGGPAEAAELGGQVGAGPSLTTFERDPLLECFQGCHQSEPIG